jgi:hypothetical protein
MAMTTKRFSPSFTDAMTNEKDIKPTSEERFKGGRCRQQSGL